MIKKIINKNINIYLILDLKEGEIRSNEINIELVKKINYLSYNRKIIRLKNGYLVVGSLLC